MNRSVSNSSVILAREVINDFYSRKALAASREAYYRYCEVGVRPQSNGILNITVKVNNEYKKQARQILLEFWNYFLDTSCKQYLESI